MQANLQRQDVINSALQGLQLMTNDYIKDNARFYMTLESFSNSRKCERMIAKIRFQCLFNCSIISYFHIRKLHEYLYVA